MDIQRDELIGDLQVAGSYPFKSLRQSICVRELRYTLTWPD